MNTSQKIFSTVVLVYFLLAGAVLAQEPNRDDLAIFGMRAKRITNPCDPAIPSAQSQATNTCATAQVFPPTSTTSNWSVDISWFDPLTKKYYVADRNNFGVDIVDAVTDTVLGVAGGAGSPGAFVGNRTAANSSGPNGALVTTNPHQLWAGDGDSTVKVFTLNANGDTATFLKSISTGGVNQLRADELAYDPDDQLILVANDDDTELFVTFIKVSANKNNIVITGKISFLTGNPAGCPIGGCSTGGIEQPVYDHGTRLFYLAVPQTNLHPNGEIAVIDPKTMKVTNAFGLTDVNGNQIPCFPHGLAQGPNQQLLVGCSADTNTTFPSHALMSLVINASNGSLVRQINQVGGSDEVWYNPGDNTYYLAASNWQLDKNGVGFVCAATGAPANCPATAAPVLGIIDAGSDADGPEFIQNVKTGASAHSVAAIFYPTENTKFDHGKGQKASDHDFVNKVYVPLRVNTAGGETGGIGVVGRIP